MAQRDGQRAVAAHRMAGDPLPAFVDRELRRDQRRQLLGDIGPHPIMAGPRLLGRIDVEAGALPEILGAVGRRSERPRRAGWCPARRRSGRARRRRRDTRPSR